ncbi:MAG: sigma-70 family RNA polymerase sigma factor [Actinomycetota bacterium]|nr:sigma-70 family RNA polymerase sigma factor [Actinomycetota bacterium]
MDGEELTDETLAAARQGDGPALRRVYEWLAPAVQGYLRAKGADDPEALTGDVFVALLPLIPRLVGGPSHLRTLTFSIAHARAVDDHRRRSRRPARLPYFPSEDLRVVESAEDSAHTRLATEHVLTILNLLPQEQRDVLSLRIVAGLSIDQVAEIMGKSAGAVKQLQRRGLIAVREALAARQVTL